MALLQMICTPNGYAITDEHNQVYIRFSVKMGQPIYMDHYRDPSRPEMTSIFLRGVLAAAAQFAFPLHR